MPSPPDDGDASVSDASQSRADAPPTSDDDEPSTHAPDDGPQVRADGRRDVVVPIRLYKTVTVFSTLIAVACVVSGFVVLDAATIQWSFLRRFVSGTLARVGVGVPSAVLSAALAVVALVAIGFGAGVYVLGSRFRARGMGKSQEDSDEETNNG